MKAVVLDGTGTRSVAAESVRRALDDELASHGWETQTFVLRDLDIPPCVGDFLCWVKTPGVCQVEGAGRVIAEAVARSDLLVFLTPVSFGGYSYELKKAVDHLIPLVSPFFQKIDGEVHHEPRYTHYPRLLGIGLLPEPDEESEGVFKTLVRRNAINMHTTHAAAVLNDCQSPDEIRSAVRSLVTGLA